jgi:hypothetical protein
MVRRLDANAMLRCEVCIERGGTGEPQHAEQTIVLLLYTALPAEARCPNPAFYGWRSNRVNRTVGRSPTLH